MARKSRPIVVIKDKQYVFLPTPDNDYHCSQKGVYKCCFDIGMMCTKPGNHKDGVMALGCVRKLPSRKFGDNKRYFYYVEEKDFGNENQNQP